MRRSKKRQDFCHQKKPHAFQQERAAAFFDALDQLCGAASVSMSCNRLSASAAFNV
jgi:hypothetical protein